MKKISDKLPDKPSALIQVALRDLAAVERQPKRFRVCMAFWNNYHEKRCDVCLAGAVMVQTLNTRASTVEPALGPNDFPTGIARKLHALEYFRNGEMWEASCELDLEFPEKLYRERTVTDYRVNPARFKKDMRAMAKALKEAGF